MSEENNKGKIPIYAYGEESFWYGEDYVHEIKQSELKDWLAHNYWKGVLMGILCTTIGGAIGVLILFNH
jgi:hypothetical protein